MKSTQSRVGQTPPGRRPRRPRKWLSANKRVSLSIRASGAAASGERIGVCRGTGAGYARAGRVAGELGVGACTGARGGAGKRGGAAKGGGLQGVEVL